MLVVENQHDTKDCPYELLFYPLKMLLTGGAVEFSIRARYPEMPKNKLIIISPAPVAYMLESVYLGALT